MAKINDKIGIVVVAAGLGSRLAPLTNDKPKCLVHVNKKPILWYILKNIAAFKWKRIFLVVGYKKEQIIDFQRSNFPDLKIEFLENNKPETTGCLDSLMMVPYCEDIDHLCYTNSDLLLSRNAFQRVLFDKNDNTIGVKKLEIPGIPTSVLQKATVKNGRVLQMDLMLEKKYTHEAIGPVKLNTNYFEAIRRRWSNPTGGKPTDNRCYSAIGECLHEYILSAVCLNDNEWAEVNTRNDVSAAGEKVIRFKNDIRSL